MSPIAKQKWRAVAVQPITPIAIASDLSFDEVMRSRRSCRQMTPLDPELTFSLLRHVLRQQHRFGLGRPQHKSVLSAGALHPIDLIVLTGPDVDVPTLYDDESDQFLLLAVDDHDGLQRAVSEAQEILPEARGHLILMTGDLARVASAYDNPVSLLWRDSGAVLQLTAMAATACGIGFCPLGVLGIAALKAIEGSAGDRVALGMAILGQPLLD